MSRRYNGNWCVLTVALIFSQLFAGENSRAPYLDLMKKTLINSIYQDPSFDPFGAGTNPYQQSIRDLGRDWPSQAHTMVGLKRLDNIQYCAEVIYQDGIEGDFIETGVWRGGSTIFMRAILKAYDDQYRKVWVADSFSGIPLPSALNRFDASLALHSHNRVLAVSLETVQENFRRYGLLDEQVHFLKGWFKDTLPSAPIDKIALLRLDGDLYESTWDALSNLYSKLSIGGFVIIDDYQIEACRQATNDFRKNNNITEEIMPIDGLGVFWRRLR